MVLNAAQHQGAAVSRRAGAHFFRRHPHGAHDAAVELRTGNGIAEIAAKGKAQVGDVFCCAISLRRTHKVRQIHAHQGSWREAMCGFFKGFASAPGFGRFARV